MERWLAAEATLSTRRCWHGVCSRARRRWRVVVAFAVVATAAVGAILGPDVSIVSAAVVVSSGSWAGGAVPGAKIETSWLSFGLSCTGVYNSSPPALKTSQVPPPASPVLQEQKRPKRAPRRVPSCTASVGASPNTPTEAVHQQASRASPDLASMAKQMMALLPKEQLAILKKNFKGRSHVVGTMCSGSDVVTEALSALAEACEGTIAHTFSCEILACNQRWIMTQCDPPPQILYNDITEFHTGKGYDVLSHKQRPLPVADIIYVGFSCKDVSRLNIHSGGANGCIAKEALRTGLGHVCGPEPTVLCTWGREDGA